MRSFPGVDLSLAATTLLLLSVSSACGGSGGEPEDSDGGTGGAGAKGNGGDGGSGGTGTGAFPGDGGDGGKGDGGAGTGASPAGGGSGGQATLGTLPAADIEWVELEPAPRLNQGAEVLVSRTSSRVFWGMFYTDDIDSLVTDPWVEMDQVPIVLGANGDPYAESSNSVQQSTDNGETWASVATTRGVDQLNNLFAPTQEGLFIGPDEATGRGVEWWDVGLETWITTTQDTGGLRFDTRGDLYTGPLRYQRSRNRWDDFISGNGSSILAEPLHAVPVHLTAGGAYFFRIAEDTYVTMDHGQTYRNVGEYWMDMASNPDGVTASTRLVGDVAGVYFEGRFEETPVLDRLADVGVLADGRILASADGNLYISNAAPRATLAVAVTSPTCADGVESDDEDEVDCGGECRACSNWEVMPSVPEGHRFEVSQATDTVFTVSGWSSSADEAVFSRSSDRGRTWEHTTLGEGAGGIAVASNGDVYYSDFYATWRSSDDGVSFEKVSDLVDYLGSGENRIDPDGNLYSFAIDNCARSLDQGASWEVCTNPGTFETLFLSSGALVTRDEVSEVYKSTDQATTWDLLSVPWEGIINRMVLAGPGLVAAHISSGETWITEDDGESWQAVVAPPEETNPLSQVYKISTETYVYLGESIWTSADLETWVQQGEDGASAQMVPWFQFNDGSLFAQHAKNQWAYVSAPPSGW